MVLNQHPGMRHLMTLRVSFEAVVFEFWILRPILYHLFQFIVYQCFSPKFTTSV